VVGNYGRGTIKSYLAEIRLLFHYHHEKTVEQIDQQCIMDYMLFIKKVHEVGRAKCRSVAQSCAFFFRNVIRKEFVLPTKLYPRNEFRLPEVMTQTQIKTLFAAIQDLSQRAVISSNNACLKKKASTLQFVRFVIKERLNEELLITMEFYRPSYLNELLCIPHLRKHLKKMYDIKPFSKLQH
jgi:hypothetical protein